MNLVSCEFTLRTLEPSSAQRFAQQDCNEIHPTFPDNCLWARPGIFSTELYTMHPLYAVPWCYAMFNHFAIALGTWWVPLSVPRNFPLGRKYNLFSLQLDPSHLWFPIYWSFFLSIVWSQTKINLPPFLISMLKISTSVFLTKIHPYSSLDKLIKFFGVVKIEKEIQSATPGIIVNGWK